MLDVDLIQYQGAKTLYCLLLRDPSEEVFLIWLVPILCHPRLLKPQLCCSSPLGPSSCLSSFHWQMIVLTSLIATPKHISPCTLAHMHMHAHSYFIFGSKYHFLGEECLYSFLCCGLICLQIAVHSVNAEETASKWSKSVSIKN